MHSASTAGREISGLRSSGRCWPHLRLGVEAVGALLLDGFALGWLWFSSGLLRYRFLGLAKCKNPLGLGQMVDCVLVGNAGVGGERQAQREMRELVILQPIRDREQDFFCALLEDFVVAHVVCGYVVGVAAGVDGDEGAEEHTKVRRCEGGWRMFEDSVKSLGAALHQTLAALLLLLMFPPALLGLRVDGNNATGMVGLRTYPLMPGSIAIRICQIISKTTDGGNEFCLGQKRRTLLTSVDYERLIRSDFAFATWRSVS
jgi:hypothetical protein